eukprot:3226592-Alexandrium_andersonii.AAC.1
MPRVRPWACRPWSLRREKDFLRVKFQHDGSSGNFRKDVSADSDSGSTAGLPQARPGSVSYTHLTLPTICSV